MYRLLVFFLLVIGGMHTALADAPPLRGYDKSLPSPYQYVLFGTYPQGENGESAPLLWRVLGPGVPGEGDVINAGNCPNRNAELPLNGDVFTPENADVFVLMTEYIVDFIDFHTHKDTVEHPLDYHDSLMYDTLNTQVISLMFTADERAALVDMPGRGLLALPSRKGELHREDYGFVARDFVKWKERTATGTPYAYAQGLKNLKGFSWYFTTDWRRYGYRWIIGDDGHISVSGIDRKGGIRPICYVHSSMLTCTGGSGTFEDPLRLQVREESPPAHKGRKARIRHDSSAF